MPVLDTLFLRCFEVWLAYKEVLSIVSVPDTSIR